MSRRGNKHSSRKRPAPQAPAASSRKPAAATAPAAGDPPQDSAGKWLDRTGLVWRTFPGPEQVDVPLRVACDPGAYAELVAHAKESLDAEICGVLVGEMCEDRQGGFVHVKAVIRGAAARQHGTHVTYTQETWNAIHQELEQKYPNLGIVGWYHSHPGFGVEFSEMDLFIQKNFFSGPMQVALVSDPLGGEEAICFNGPDGIGYLDRFWVDGRERTCRVSKKGGAVAAHAAPSELAEALQRVETRLTQLIQAQDRQQTSFQRFLLTVGMVVVVGISLWLTYSLYRSMTSSYEPPRLRSYVEVPIQIGDKRVLVGMNVVSWDVPPELNALYLQLAEKRRAEAEAAAAEKEAQKQEAQKQEAQKQEAQKKEAQKKAGKKKEAKSQGSAAGKKKDAKPQEPTAGKGTGK